MIKILLLFTLLILFWKELRKLAPHWRILVSLGIGAAIGILYAVFLARFGILKQAGQMLGTGKKGFLLVVIMFCMVAGLFTFLPIARSMFPDKEKKE